MAELHDSSAALMCLSDVASHGNHNDISSSPRSSLYDNHNSDPEHTEYVHARSGRTVMSGRRKAITDAGPPPSSTFEENSQDGSISPRPSSSSSFSPSSSLSNTTTLHLSRSRDSEGSETPTTQQMLYTERRTLLHEAQDLHRHLRDLYEEESRIHEQILAMRTTQAEIQDRFFEITAKLKQTGRVRRLDSWGDLGI